MSTWSQNGENGVGCIVHECHDVAKNAPILDGRRARCAYFGKPVKGGSYNSNACSTCRVGSSCACEAPSSPRLWFFEFCGEGSPAAKEYCKNCNGYKDWHYPIWELRLKLTRRWYKIDPHLEERKTAKHLPDEETAKLWAEAERQRQLHWCDHSPETKVREVEIISLVMKPTDHKCTNFEERGPLPFDKFYCACHGAD